MIIKEECIGCGSCVPYCPMEAIILKEDKAIIDQDECVECNACLRVEVCSMDAIEMPKLEWPRNIRQELSDPSCRHSSTGGPGRGTSEMKTNEVTGRYQRGKVGFGIEVGRPGLGTRLRDVETIAMMLKKADVGVLFAEENPTTFFMVDRETGKFKDELLDEKVLTIILEFLADSEKLPEVLKVLEAASKEIDSVFVISMISRAEEDETIHNVEIVKNLGYKLGLGAKVNIGIGYPSKNDVVMKEE